MHTNVWMYFDQQQQAVGSGYKKYKCKMTVNIFISIYLKLNTDQAKAQTLQE